MSNEKENITASEDDYSLSGQAEQSTFEAPQLPYQPRNPQSYRPNIALIGCGGITATHLKAYQNAGYHVVALCDKIEENARKRQQEWYPNAQIYTDAREVLSAMMWKWSISPRTRRSEYHLSKKLFLHANTS
jgi:hypothetical protein